MARWEPGAAARLRTAALELFEENGFTATTVPDIAARAGLTQRTFFRHFSDKREVFFGDDEIPTLAARLIDDAPADVPPYAIVSAGLRSLAVERFEPRRAEMRAARRIIETEPALRERDLRKQADLRDAVAAAFERRGVEPVQARAIGAVAVQLIQLSLEAWWADESDTPLTAHLDATEAALRSILPATTPTG